MDNQEDCYVFDPDDPLWDDAIDFINFHLGLQITSLDSLPDEAYRRVMQGMFGVYAAEAGKASKAKTSELSDVGSNAYYIAFYMREHLVKEGGKIYREGN